MTLRNSEARKRTWRIGALSCVALGLALSGCSSSEPGNSASAQTAAEVGSQWRNCTEQVTLATRTGQMRACVVYSYSDGQPRVASVGASYSANNGYDLPYFTFVFRQPSGAVIDYQYASPVFHAENVYSRNTGLIHLSTTADIHAGDVLQVSLRAIEASSGQVEQMASVTLTLYPQGLSCPALGTDSGTNEGTGQC